MVGVQRKTFASENEPHQNVECCPRFWQTLLLQQLTLVLHKSAPLHPMPQPLSVLQNATESDQQIHIHTEDGNCSVCPNIGQLSTFDIAHSQNLVLRNLTMMNVA